MLIDQFQQWTTDRWTTKPTRNTEYQLLRSLYVMSTGLGGECGEVLELLKKSVRDGGLDKEHLKLELGDVLHYLSRIATTYGMTMTDIIHANVKKLTDRDLHGKRDNRTHQKGASRKKPTVR